MSSKLKQGVSLFIRIDLTLSRVNLTYKFLYCPFSFYLNFNI